MVEPCLSASREGAGEEDIGRARLGEVDIGKEEHIRAVVCPIVVLQQEAVGALDADGMGQVVALHHVDVPLQILVVFGFLQQDKTVCMALEFLHRGMQPGIACLMVFQSQ